MSKFTNALPDAADRIAGAHETWQETNGDPATDGELEAVYGPEHEVEQDWLGRPIPLFDQRHSINKPAATTPAPKWSADQMAKGKANRQELLRGDRTDGDILDAHAAAFAGRFPTPSDRVFNPPPADADGAELAPSGRPRPLKRENDNDYSGYRFERESLRRERDGAEASTSQPDGTPGIMKLGGPVDLSDMTAFAHAAHQLHSGASQSEADQPTDRSSNVHDGGRGFANPTNQAAAQRALGRNYKGPGS